MCAIVIRMYDEEGLYPTKYTPILPLDKEMAENSGMKLCSPFWDSLSCFPATPAGEVKVIPCMAEIQTVHRDQIYNYKYDTTSK